MRNDAPWNAILAQGGPGALAIGHNVDRVLDAVRTHLGMDVAFISEFGGHYRTFRHVAGSIEPMPIRPGDSSPLDEGYCLRVVEGRIPQLIPDTAAVVGGARFRRPRWFPSARTSAFPSACATAASTAPSAVSACARTCRWANATCT